MLFMLVTPTGSPATSRASLRRAIRRPHPLSVHPIHGPIELFDDAIETAGSVSCLGGMLVQLPFFGRPHSMHPARYDGERSHTSRDRQPFQ
jgi:hypothetical protein